MNDRGGQIGTLTEARFPRFVVECHSFEGAGLRCVEPQYVVKNATMAPSSLTPGPSHAFSSCRFASEIINEARLYQGSKSGRFPRYVTFWDGLTVTSWRPRIELTLPTINTYSPSWGRGLG